jgi:flagellar export protein FliJ
MKAFRFRAQAALDLRRREYEARERDLARAQCDRAIAQETLRAAEEAAGDARRAATEALRARVAAHEIEWHRSWTLRLEQQCEAHRARVRALDDAVARAAAVCQEAHRRCRSLEKFRDKAQGAFNAAAAVTERRALDELATRRFTAKQ